MISRQCGQPNRLNNGHVSLLTQLITWSNMNVKIARGLWQGWYQYIQLSPRSFSPFDAYLWVKVKSNRRFRSLSHWFSTGARQITHWYHLPNCTLQCIYYIMITMDPCTCTRCDAWMLVKDCCGSHFSIQRQRHREQIVVETGMASDSYHVRKQRKRGENNRQRKYRLSLKHSTYSVDRYALLPHPLQLLLQILVVGRHRVRALMDGGDGIHHLLILVVAATRRVRSLRDTILAIERECWS